MAAGRGDRGRAGPVRLVPVVGEVPRGLPALGIPAVSLSDLVDLFPTAVAVALISFADTSVISHSFAARRGERVDPDHELAALGITDSARPCRRLRRQRERDQDARRGAGRCAHAGHRPHRRHRHPGAPGLRPGPARAGPTAALAAVVVSAAVTLFDVDGLRHLWMVRADRADARGRRLLRGRSCSGHCPASGPLSPCR